LLHRLGLDEPLDGTVDRRVKAFFHGEFFLKEIFRKDIRPGKQSLRRAVEYVLICKIAAREYHCACYDSRARIAATFLSRLQAKRASC